MSIINKLKAVADIITPPTGYKTLFFRSDTGVPAVKDDNGTVSDLVIGGDASGVTYTPFDSLDWSDSTDPGNVDDALDDLASRTRELENSTAEPEDAAEVTYTPAVLADWVGAVDPGDVKEGLDQLAERVTEIEGAAVDASTVTYTPSNSIHWTDSEDPGNVDDALDDVVARVQALEEGGGAGTGDVVGPASSTTNAIAKWADTTGELLADSGVTIDGSNNVSGVAALAATTIELGHASDTTISRSGAGDIAIEGNAVYRAGGTDVPVADGGTGVSSLTAYAPIFGGTTGTGAVQSGTVGSAGEVLTSNGAGALPTFQASAGGITLATPQATTSGTTKDFTGIPAGTKRIVVHFVGVSVSGTSVVLIQIGDSGGIENTGYTCVASGFATAIGSTSFTTGFGLINSSTAAYAHSGQVTLQLEDSSDNTWTCHGGTTVPSVTAQGLTSGSKALSATLDRVRITTVNGTDTFDAGEVNISYSS